MKHGLNTESTKERRENSGIEPMNLRAREIVYARVGRASWPFPFVILSLDRFMRRHIRPYFLSFNYANFRILVRVLPVLHPWLKIQPVKPARDALASGCV